MRFPRCHRLNRGRERREAKEEEESARNCRCAAERGGGASAHQVPLVRMDHVSKVLGVAVRLERGDEVLDVLTCCQQRAAHRGGAVRWCGSSRPRVRGGSRSTASCVSAKRPRASTCKIDNGGVAVQLLRCRPWRAAPWMLTSPRISVIRPLLKVKCHRASDPTPATRRSSSTCAKSLRPPRYGSAR